ncbi:MAG: hypothetical protein U0326_17135 [Polyangiales bacterium]
MLLDLVITLIVRLARWFSRALDRLRRRAPVKSRAWRRVDDAWITDDAHHIDVFLFAQSILQAGLWLPVLSSRDPARDEETARVDAASLRRTRGLEALVVLPFFQGGALHYLIRLDVDERTLWLALVDLDPAHDRGLVTSLLRAHPRGLKRVDGSSFTANGIVVVEGAEIEVAEGGEWRRGWLHIVKGCPYLASTHDTAPISLRSEVRLCPPPVEADATESPAEAPSVVHEFGLARCHEGRRGECCGVPRGRR